MFPRLFNHLKAQLPDLTKLLGSVGVSVATFLSSRFLEYPLDVQLIASGAVLALCGFILRSWGSSQTRDTGLIHPDGKPMLATQLDRRGRTVSAVLIVGGTVALLAGFYITVDLATINDAAGSNVMLWEPTKGLNNPPGIYSFEGKQIEPYYGITFRAHRSTGFDKVIITEIGVSYRWVDAKKVTPVFGAVPADVEEAVVYSAALSKTGTTATGTLKSEEKQIEGQLILAKETQSRFVRIDFEGEPGIYLVQPHIRVTTESGSRKRIVSNGSAFWIIVLAKDDEKL